MDPREFEQEIRRLCDAAYERPSSTNNPMLALVEGRLPLEEARRFWGQRWRRILVLNQHLLPALLRACPDLESRALLWRSISVEYGEGRYDRSHPALYANFLRALGAPAGDCPTVLAEEDPAARALVAAVEGASWLELLGGFLARETVGPKVFHLLAHALRRSYGLTEADVEWFSVHSVQDLDDANDVFDLVRTFGATADSQREIKDAVLRWFEGSPEYCCALGLPLVTYAASRPTARSAVAP